jgi:hypothetical protein
VVVLGIEARMVAAVVDYDGDDDEVVVVKGGDYSEMDSFARTI